MTLAISAHAPGRVDVFSIDLPPPEFAAFVADRAQIAQALGAAPNMDQVDTFDTALMGDLGLSGFLNDGIGIERSDLAPHAATLGDITHAMVIRAEAFGGQAVTLTPTAPLRHVVTLNEERARIDMTPLQSSGATGHLAPPEPPAPRRRAKSRWLWLGVALAAILLVATILPIFLSL